MIVTMIYFVPKSVLQLSKLYFFSPLLINMQVPLYPHEISKYIVVSSLPERYSELQTNEITAKVKATQGFLNGLSLANTDI